MNMDIFDVLTLLGGLCLFLFGMNIMGQALERRAGGKLRNILSKMTSNKGTGFLTGCGVTAIIQSSSATTVMVVGFVNAGILNLRTDDSTSVHQRDYGCQCWNHRHQLDPFSWRD